MKIIDYIVVTAISPYELMVNVKANMKDGWQPYGGVVYGDSGRLYLQAMVKYSDEVKVINNSNGLPTTRTPFDIDESRVDINEDIL